MAWLVAWSDARQVGDLHAEQRLAGSGAQKRELLNVEIDDRAMAETMVSRASRKGGYGAKRGALAGRERGKRGH